MKAGKLICVGIRGAVPGEDLLERDLSACAEAGVGGVILFDVDVPAYRRFLQAGLSESAARTRAVRNIQAPDQVRKLTAHIRRTLGPEVFICLDQEGGRVARLAPRLGFDAVGSAREFARLGPPEQASAAARQAAQLADLGFDLNFAPCVDLALEPDNAIISQLERSYGADPDEVVRCADVVLAAHQKAGVAACLKHFPGHGSSRGDTHLGAVEITGTWHRAQELKPFCALLGRPGVAVMVAHVVHRHLGGDRPASLSTEIITGLLRGELGFDGVVVTDAIDMQAVADRFSPEEAVVSAVTAGADLVIDAFNLTERAEHPARRLVSALEEAFADGRIPGGEPRLSQSLVRLSRLRAECA